MKEPNDLFNEGFINSRTHKRKFLPWWMKIFIWIFLVFTAFIPIVILFSLFGHKINISLYGIETNNSLSASGFFLMALFILKGIVSYGLWMGQKWAIKLGMIDAIFGILVCLYAMFESFFNNTNNEFNFRLELLILTPYLIKLIRIRPIWNHF